MNKITETPWVMYFEDEGDMRLAVAAPELLEACKKAMLELGVLNENYAAPVAHAYGILEAAIARANGNS